MTYVRGHERGNPFYLWYLSRPVHVDCLTLRYFGAVHIFTGKAEVKNFAVFVLLETPISLEYGFTVSSHVALLR